MALDYATLSINWARDFDLQNTKDLIGFSQLDSLHRDDLSITPYNLSRYFLYNRDLPPNTLNGRLINDYIRYRGGFITAGNKINSKYSNFTTNDTITVYLTSNFHSGLNMLDNRIRDLRRLGTIGILTGETRDNEALTVGDFKKFSYYKGMIMMWSGTHDQLTKNLPYWRLCAPPHSDSSPVNTVVVPNLQGKFIMGGRSAGSASPKVGDTGGGNRIKLVVDNLPTHKHNYNIVLAGAQGSLGPNTTFYTGPNTITNGNNTQQHAHTGKDGTQVISDTINLVTRNPITNTEITIPPQQSVQFRRPSSISPNTENRGGDETHENRPPFYALAYIIYVGSN